MTTFNEFTSLRVTARFRSGSQPISPTTVHYKLINRTSGSTVIDWTQVPPSADVTIDLDARLITVNSRRRYEEQEITVAADKDTADQVTQVRSWTVRNNSAFN